MTTHDAVVRTFANEVDANLALSVLTANGVEAILLRDDAGGMLAPMSLGSGIRLVVRAEDLELARELLEAGDD